MKLELQQRPKFTQWGSKLIYFAFLAEIFADFHPEEGQIKNF